MNLVLMVLAACLTLAAALILFAGGRPDMAAGFLVASFWSLIAVSHGTEVLK